MITRFPPLTGLIADGGVDSSDQAAYMIRNAFGWDRGHFKTEPKQPTPEGQHRHVLGGKTELARYLVTATDGAHQHQIGDVHYVPSYVASKFIIRVK